MKYFATGFVLTIILMLSFRLMTTNPPAPDPPDFHFRVYKAGPRTVQVDFKGGDPLWVHIDGETYRLETIR